MLDKEAMRVVKEKTEQALRAIIGGKCDFCKRKIEGQFLVVLSSEGKLERIYCSGPCLLQDNFWECLRHQLLH